MSKIILDVSGLLNLTTAAKRLEVTRPTVYAWINSGKLHPITIGHSRYLLAQEVDSLRKPEAQCGKNTQH